MEKSPNFEIFYDVLNDSIEKLYEIKHADFFSLLIGTGKNIMTHSVNQDEVDLSQEKELMAIYDRLEGIDFSVEDIRKAFQIMVLRAFKESNLKMGDVTPDTIGIFIAYLIKKLNPTKERLNILDPAIGSGNLLYSVSNHLDNPLKIYGIDCVKTMADLASILGDLLNYDVEVFCQDLLSHPFSDMDFVLCDLPVDDKSDIYFPYLTVLMHLASLKDDGYFIAVAPNDFFDHDKDEFFKENLKKSGSVLAVISLPLDMFIANPKSIIIFTKENIDNKNCLLVELPSFKNEKKLGQTINQIEQWFEKRERRN